jgi:PAS domain S-box-containing protein
LDLEVARSLADLVSVDALVTSKGKILYSNPTCQARAISELGWTETKGRFLWDLFDEEQVQQVKEWYEELRSRDDRFGRLVLRIQTQDAPEEAETLIAIRLVDRELVVIKAPDAQPIMERLSELETMTLMFKSYLHDGGLGLMILQDEGDRHGLIRYISPEGATILERESSDVVGIEVTAFVATDEHEEIMRWYQARGTRTGEDAHQEVRFLDPMGGSFLFDVVMGGTTWNEEPAVYCLFRDETARGIMIDELRRFAQGFEMLNDTMVMADKDFNVIYVNPEGLRRSGYTFEEVLGQPAYIFSRTMDGDLDPLDLATALFEKGHWSGERTAESKDGMTYPVDISVTMTPDEKGDPEMITVLSRDISERKAAERNLLRARERAEFFTDLMAHDINNYIQGVIGFLDLLTREELDPSQKENAQRAKEQAARVSELISRVRTISKAQHADELTPVDLVSVIEEAVGDMTQKYNDRTCEIRVDSPDREMMVMADGLLRDLVINLLDNAIKFSQHPTAQVDVKLEHRTFERAHNIILSVADHGPGIPDEDKASIFFRFVRKVEDSEGSGLGLSLVLALTDRYQGRVLVEDRVPGDQEKGARFIVELPAA